MHGRMHAHARVALVPIDRRGDLVADGKGRGARRILRRHVRDLALGGVGIDRGGDRHRRAVGFAERAAVAGLAAGGGVEHRAVEHDAALLGERDDARLAILANKSRRGKDIRSAWFATQVTRKAVLISDCASSQSGTGSFLPRRKSGLNSFDW